MSANRLPSLKTFAVTAVTALVGSTLFALSQPATLSIDGQRIISDVPPVTQVHDVFVPLRALADGIGANTDYDAKAGTVEVVHGADVLRFRVGSRTATLNGNTMTIKDAPFTVRGRVMVGMRAIARAMGMKYRYDASRATIDVSTQGVVEAGAQQDPP